MADTGLSLCRYANMLYATIWIAIVLNFRCSYKYTAKYEKGCSSCNWWIFPKATWRHERFVIGTNYLLLRRIDVKWNLWHVAR